MGLFGKNREKTASSSKQLIPDHLIARLPAVGQATFGSSPSYQDVSEYYLQSFLDAGTPTEDPAWSAFVDKFLTELNDASLRLGGWASAGAFYVAKDFVKSEDWNKPRAVELMDRGLGFLAGSGADGSTIPMFAQHRWIELKHA